MNTTRDLMCFSYGLGAGFALALLVAPRSGIEMRQGIRNKLHDGREKLRESTTAVTEAIGREKENLTAAIGEGKRVYREKTTRGQPMDHVVGN